MISWTADSILSCLQLSWLPESASNVWLILSEFSLLSATVISSDRRLNGTVLGLAKGVVALPCGFMRLSVGLGLFTSSSHDATPAAIATTRSDCPTQNPLNATLTRDATAHLRIHWFAKCSSTPKLERCLSCRSNGANVGVKPGRHA